MGRRAQIPNPENATMDDLLHLVKTGSLETQKRATAIWMLLIGNSRQKVYDTLHITDRALRKWIFLFNESGADGIIAGIRPGPARKITDQLSESLCSEIDHPEKNDRTFWTARAFHGYLSDEYSIECSYRTVVRFFHDNNYSLQVPRPWSDRKDEVARQKYRSGLQVICSENDTDIWYCDETGVYGEARPYRRWAPKGSKPTIVKNGEHIRMSVVGAVCPRTGQFFAIETSGCDTSIFQAFLDEAVTHTIRERKRNVMIVDNASWHKSRSLQWHCFDPLYLPPYSPDFNPIERIWLLMKQKWFNNFFCKTQEELIGRLDRSLLDLIQNPSVVKAVTQNIGTE